MAAEPQSPAAAQRYASEVIVLGSGSSTGVPSPSCVIRPADDPCLVCHRALSSPPETNKNYRCNPSLLIVYHEPHGEKRFIQIDCGKCFKEQVLRWFVRYRIPTVHAFLLTHEHADAVLGLDDVRGVQTWRSFEEAEPTPIFLSQHTFESISRMFPYLTEKAPEGSEFRRVAQIDWRVIQTDSMQPFDVHGLSVTPLPVMHGEDYICLGFLFGQHQRIAYLSDVSRIPLEVEKLISVEHGTAVDLLILDCLYKHSTHNTHMCWDESIETIVRLRPKRALLIGMTHEFEHDAANAELALLASQGIDVQLSYDGMRIPVDI